MNIKISAKIAITGKSADMIVIPLTPDNMDTIRTVVTAKDKDNDKSVVTYFEANSIGSLIASVDDYLMNAKIAQQIVELEDEV
ncbi:MAG: hypothetical protein H0M93_03805 [Methanophagales archaeon]|nr:hypothetical protein [Methanophagales archaeon]